MRKEDLFDILGDIDHQHIKAARMKNKRKNNFAWAKWGTIAACFALLLIVSIPIVNRLSPVVEENPPSAESSQIGNSNKVEALQNDKEESAEIEDLVQNEEIEYTEATEEPLQEEVSTAVPENDVEDAPADSNGEYHETVNSSDLTKDTSEFFGGSYTDSNGKFVIVLTEDTPENRAAICKELGRNENNTTFVSGTYTLEYLTELQTKISNAMINKEIPFVVSSALRETTNNIVIGATTTDESELAKLYALDTIGGAIEVEFSTGAVTKELLLVPEGE